MINKYYRVKILIKRNKWKTGLAYIERNYFWIIELFCLEIMTSGAEFKKLFLLLPSLSPFML